MSWHVLVDLDAAGPLPAGELQAALEAHPLVTAASVYSPPPPPAGWRKALAAFGRARPPSVLVTVEVEERDEAERVAAAAAEEALARTGVEGRVRAAGAFGR